MEFEYDPAKSLVNKDKHGIDFDEAQALWQDGSLVNVPARDETELRQLAIGKIGEKHWSAIHVLRGGRIRLISVRRSREKEIEHYERERERA